jgi:hypothetical protein
VRAAYSSLINQIALSCIDQKEVKKLSAKAREIRLSMLKHLMLIVRAGVIAEEMQELVVLHSALRTQHPTLGRFN